MPALVRGLESESIISARLAADELTMFVSLGIPPQIADLYTASREGRDLPFRIGAPIPSVNERGSAEYWPTVSEDGRLMFFESSRSRTPNDAGNYGVDFARIWSATRVNVATDFERPRLQSLFDTADGAEAAPYLHPNGRSLYFTSISRPGKGMLDIWLAEINSVGVVTTIRNLEAVNTATEENAPVVSSDQLSLYHSRLTPEEGVRDLFVSRRASTSDFFGASARVPELSSSAYDDYPTWVSPDHCRIYFSSSRPVQGARVDGGVDAGPPRFHLWLAERQR
jgi:WD40-like Beta Propeller Repeat